MSQRHDALYADVAYWTKKIEEDLEETKRLIEKYYQTSYDVPWELRSKLLDIEISKNLLKNDIEKYHAAGKKSSWKKFKDWLNT